METILLVDDEPDVLALASSILKAEGYTLLSTENPREALRIARAWPEPLDLLLTDVVMPGMNGRELAQRLESSRPGLKCLFTSGYTADVIARDGVVDDAAHFLQKPFSMKGLAAKVREALGPG